MKGLYNNKDAAVVLLDLKNSTSNRICEIYNMGYREGFADGQRDAMKRLADIVLAERENNDNSIKADK